jgi:hypothetical protein
MRVLITEYFNFSLKERNNEVLKCIKNNIDSGLFDRVIVLSERDECPLCETVITGERLTYKHTFEYANQHLSHGDQVFIANSDIYYDNTIKQIILDDKTAMCLTRYNIKKDDSNEIEDCKLCSQDTWAFRVPIKVPPKSDFYFGTLGCDNYITTLLKAEGYRLWNPCLSVKSYHLHLTGHRTFKNEYFVPKHNFTFVDLCEIEERSPSSFCTISTETCFDELLALLMSLRRQHPHEPIYVLADTKTRDRIPKFLDNVHVRVDLDKYHGKNREQMEKEGTWSDFQMEKANCIDIALENHPDTMFLDADIIVLDRLRIKPGYDLGVSPHYIRKERTDAVGYYNGGFMWVSNKTITQDWKLFTKTSRYHDQASIEDLAKKYNYFEFDKTYNMGWWRLIQSDSDISKNFEINGPSYEHRSIKCIHTHFAKGDFYTPFNNFITQLLIGSHRWFEVMLIERIVNGFWPLLIPAQPLPDKYRHTDDSFRELARLTAEKVDDLNALTVQGITLPRIGKVVCLYDRPQDGWMTPEVERGSLKVFMGNMDASDYDTKYSPWIFWPRRPKVLEKFLEGPQPPKDIESMFIGNIENSVQAEHRDTKWCDVIQEFHLTNGYKHLFTQEEYLTKMARSKWGLCLKGFGLKCHREVECMALGVVPLITDGIPMHSYLNPPVEGKHFLRVSTPEDVPRVIKECSNWEEMSRACREWYMENVHSSNWWYTMLKSMIYKIT